MSETRISIPQVPEGRRRSILESWRTAFEHRRGEIIEKERVEQILQEMSFPEAIDRGVLVLPGSFNLGKSPKVFHTVYSEVVGQEAAVCKPTISTHNANST